MLEKETHFSPHHSQRRNPFFLIKRNGILLSAWRFQSLLGMGQDFSKSLNGLRITLRAGRAFYWLSPLRLVQPLGYSTIEAAGWMGKTMWERRTGLCKACVCRKEIAYPGNGVHGNPPREPLQETPKRRDQKAAACQPGCESGHRATAMPETQPTSTAGSKQRVCVCVT